MNDKLKFYRNTLVEITKEAYRKKPYELKTEEAVEEAELLTKEIMLRVDEYENSFNYQTQINENSTITANYPNFFKDVNPDFLKTESMRTIVDNGPQYQANQKPYGTLGEHWKELMLLFEIKEKQGLDVVKNMYNNGVLAIATDCKTAIKLSKLINTLGGDFIKDFVKACEKCED